MRCLIFGATGLIGSHLAAHCDDRGFARLGTWYRWPQSEHVPVDLRDTEAVADLVADYQPDVTFLAAGPNDAGSCNAFPDECRQVVVCGTRHVAEAVRRNGGSLVLFSSDEVFGECATARREDDPLTPAGLFAACKAEAERVVRRALPNRHLIVRTSWVFGPDERGRNVGGTLARKLAGGEPVEAATDAYGHPTYAADLAAAAVALARGGHTGTVHVTGPDRHTEFTFARLASHVFGADTDLIDGRTAAEVGITARPRRVWLDRFKLRTLLGARAVRTAADGLRALRDELAPSALRVRAA